jgi:hypothetical protein
LGFGAVTLASDPWLVRVVDKVDPIGPAKVLVTSP